MPSLSSSLYRTSAAFQNSWEIAKQNLPDVIDNSHVPIKKWHLSAWPNGKLHIVLVYDKLTN